MSTRSEIGILNNDGTVTSIYCHWDGYPANNGNILFNNYNTEEKARELISNGNLSGLGKDINPAKEFLHDFDHSQIDVCVYYHRDRGDEWEDCKPQNYSSIEKWKKEIAEGWQDYVYLFKNNKWYFAEVNYIDENTNEVGELIELTKAFLDKEIQRTWGEE